MQLKPGNFCPLIKKECVQMKCNWFIQIRGTDSNTGKEVDEWGCSVAWLPHLLIENAQQIRQAGAATESFRNEFVKSTEMPLHAAILQQSTKEIPLRIIDDKNDNNQR